MSGNHAPFKQAVEVTVIRASPLVEKNDYLKEAVICKFCNNKRFWLIRCESCGRTEQKILLEET